MQVQLLHVHRFFYKHLIIQIVQKNKLSKLPAKRIGLRKQEETGNSS